MKLLLCLIFNCVMDEVLCIALGSYAAVKQSKYTNTHIVCALKANKEKGVKMCLFNVASCEAIEHSILLFQLFDEGRDNDA